MVLKSSVRGWAQETGWPGPARLYFSPNTFTISGGSSWNVSETGLPQPV